MDWTRPIDAYCERLGPGFWAEPVNALTNGAFFVAAFVALGLAWRSRRLDGPVALLAALAAVIGAGSFLFHTYATLWAALADTVPISLFILAYFAVAMNRFGGLGWRMAALLTIAFLAASIGFSALAGRLLGGLLGGSEGYLPALLALVGVGLWLRTRRHPASQGLLVGSAIFAVSLALRTADGPLCAELPYGTHFLWHILNGLLLGVLLVTLIRHGSGKRKHLAQSPASS